MNDYLNFVHFHLKHTLNRKACEEWKKMKTVNVPSYLTNKFTKKNLTGEVDIEGKEIDLSYRMYFKIITCFLVSWIIYGLAETLFIHSIYSHDTEAFISLNSMCSGLPHWYLSIITPGEIGVQEGIITIVLSSFVAVEVAAGITVLIRIWSSIIEFILIGFAFYLDKNNSY